MFHIILSNTKEIIRIRTIDEVKRILERLAAGDNEIITSGGAFNPSYHVGIIYSDKGARDEAYLKNIGFKDEKSSPFAKLFSDQMKMLPEND